MVKRPINSGKTVYQVGASALELLRTHDAPEWETNLKAYLATVETLKARYAQEREMQRIPIEITPGQTITLSPGGQNVLVEQIINEFAPRFTPGGKLIYVSGDGVSQSEGNAPIYPGNILGDRGMGSGVADAHDSF